MIGVFKISKTVRTFSFTPMPRKRGSSKKAIAAAAASVRARRAANSSDRVESGHTTEQSSSIRDPIEPAPTVQPVVVSVSSTDDEVDTTTSCSSGTGSSEYWSDLDIPTAAPAMPMFIKRRASRDGTSRATLFRRKAAIKKVRASTSDIRSFFKAVQPAPSDPLSSETHSEEENSEPCAARPASSSHDRENPDDLPPPSQWSDEEPFLPRQPDDDEAASSTDGSVKAAGRGLHYDGSDVDAVSEAIKQRFNLPNQGAALQMLRAVQHLLLSVVNQKVPRKHASKLAAKHILNKKSHHAARQVLHWALEFKRTGDIALSSRGRHSKRQRAIDIDFVRHDILEMLDERRRTSAAKFLVVLNQYLENNGFATVSPRTARKWLTRDLGFRRHNRKKGVYFDGHDRPDVQQYLHEIYIPTMDKIECRRRQYVGDEMEVVILPEDHDQPEIRVCYHDESTIHQR